MKAETQKSIEQNFPEFFSPDHYKDNPELQKKLNEGYEYVDKVAAEHDKLSREDQIAFTAVIRARAAAFPLLHANNETLKAEVSALKEELKKYRGSDPGSVESRPSGGASEQSKEALSIEAMASEFDK